MAQATGHEVDSIDRQLIRLLQERPRASYAELARASGVPESTVRRRVESLYEAGTISTIVAPDIAQLGYEAVSLIGIKADLNHVEEIAEHLRQREEVTMVLITLGRLNLFCGVALRSVEDMYPFLREHVAPLPGVRDVETFVSISTVKLFRDWRVPGEAVSGER
ncbi:MAG TPA: Lrp/AsnC family transcriptional regulator [Thermomicrobiales bacterium]|nr:Lrp/AsnC family transcriptional regulator [Thermomicrobiales bacterium]